jgi:hypothetical protein
METDERDWADKTGVGPQNARWVGWKSSKQVKKQFGGTGK